MSRLISLLCVLLASFSSTCVAQSDPSSALPGVIVDNTNAERQGVWKESTAVKPYYGAGYIHDENSGKGEKSVTYNLQVPKEDQYQLLVSYTSGGGRAKSVPVDLQIGDESTELRLNEQSRPTWPLGFQPLGDPIGIKPGQPVAVVIRTEGTRGHVIADAVWLVPESKLEAAKAAAKKLAPAAAVAKKQTNDKPKPKPEPPKPVVFEPLASSRPLMRLTAEELDELLEDVVPGITKGPVATDEHFLRRATLDLLGRQPTLLELQSFLANTSDDKRAEAVNRLLEQSEYGGNWANYWSDVIGSRQQEPELTFHDYGPFKRWLAEQLNEGKRWDETIFRMMTARGKVGANPETTFIAFHQANANRLAGETARVFLSTKIACAECHDHPFEDMPQEVFHGMAAFFIRSDAKIAQLDSSNIAVASKDKGEQRISGKKGDVAPRNLSGDVLDLGVADMDRRVTLGRWLVSADNKRFAESYVNRIWARLLGRGFADPVDDMGENATVVAPEILGRLADHFVAHQYDHRELLRLILATKAYQRAYPMEGKTPLMTAVAKKLRGDEVFDSLVRAIEIENITPPREKKTGAVRFPPPPKSTRDLVNDAFGFDPSFADNLIVRTMKQSMFMMNNPQIQKHVDGKPDSNSVLAKILAEETDNAKVITTLYRRVLARSPTSSEVAIATDHIKSVGNRKAAFEDLLWSLLNSAEFTTKY